MDDRLLLHPTTEKHLKAFLVSPANALLVSGQLGAGKKSVARMLSAQLLTTSTDKLDSHPHFFIIRRPESKSEIPIEDIRSLIKDTSLRVASNMPINRVALIEDAENLSIEAQNALLKLLEEPPAGTLIILTATSEDKLLPTIISRVQRLKVLPPAMDSSIEYFKAFPAAEVQSSWRLARGATGLQSAILNGKSGHPLKAAVEDAKAFIKMDKYQRLLITQQLAKDKTQTLVFLEALSRLLSALQLDAAAKHNTSLTNRLLSTRQAIERQHNYSAANVNTRLSSLALALDISL